MVGQVRRHKIRALVRKVWISGGLVALLVACGGAPQRTLFNGQVVAVIDEACAARIKPFYDALRDLNSRLGVGLNKPAYSEKLGDISVVHDAAVREGPFESGACIDNMRKLESAFTAYTDAGNKWDACIRETGCSMDTVQPQL